MRLPLILGGLALAGGALFVVAQAEAGPAVQGEVAAATPVVVYKTPTCGCCSKWVTHLEEAGFEVETRDMDDLSALKAEMGVGPQLQSCHTAVVGEYVVEGHVPADAIVKMLEEQPEIAGLAVPGMPVGSPGMEQGSRVDPYDILAFDRTGNVKVYDRRP